MCWYILQYMPINTSLFWHEFCWYLVNMCKSKTKIVKCCTCLSPVQGSGLCQSPAFLGHLPPVPAGDTGTIQHSMPDRMDTCYPGGECDNVVKPGTRRALFYINSWAMVFPSDHPADWKSKHKVISAVSTVNIALKVDSSAVWHQIGMFTINLWTNTQAYMLWCANTNQCKSIHNNAYHNTYKF